MPQVKLNRLWGWGWKLEKTRQDIDEGRLSMSDGPIEVSRLDSPRGSFLILDGYHRAMEAADANAGFIEIRLSSQIPRIERTGGAYREALADKRRLPV